MNEIKKFRNYYKKTNPPVAKKKVKQKIFLKTKNIYYRHTEFKDA